MASWLDAITSPLKSAGEVAKGLIDIRDTAKFGEAVIQLQAEIMTAQQGAFAAQARESAMAEEVRQLKEKVARFEAWEAEKQRYRLQEIPPGKFVYSLKREEARGEPLHKLCANCYNHGRKSLLHSSAPSRGVTRHKCPACGDKFDTGYAEPINVNRGRFV